MKELIIINQSIKIDIEKIGLELLKLHNQNESLKTVLAFGMLDAKLMDLAENNLKDGIKNAIKDKDDANLFEAKIKRFVSECMQEISVVIYSNA